LLLIGLLSREAGFLARIVPFPARFATIDVA